MTTLHGAPTDISTDGFAGTVLREGDDGYDAVRFGWNAVFDRRPAVILRCGSTEDVVAAIGVARRSGREIAVRGRRTQPVRPEHDRGRRPDRPVADARIEIDTDRRARPGPAGRHLARARRRDRRRTASRRRAA